MGANEKPLAVVTVDSATARRLHDGWNFIQSPYFARRPSLRSLSTDGRRQASPLTAVGVATVADLLLLLRWTLTCTDRVRGQSEGIQTLFSEPPSWMPPSNSASATRRWQSGCSAPLKKATRRKSLNRSVHSLLLLLPLQPIRVHQPPQRPITPVRPNTATAASDEYYQVRPASRPPWSLP